MRLIRFKLRKREALCFSLFLTIGDKKTDLQRSVWKTLKGGKTNLGRFIDEPWKVREQTLEGS